MFKFSRYADLLQRLAVVPLTLLCVLAVLTVVPRAAAVFGPTLPRSTPPLTTAEVQPSHDVAAHFKEQDDRIAAELRASKDQIASELTTLKERVQAQQSLIASLTTLTGLYVVILSLAAYARLQQTKEESKDAVTETRARMQEFREEVRADIPALHGIAGRLESLLSELNARLPVDGDWTSPSTFRTLDDDQIQQALIDEMVINSLDIFNIGQDANNRRTVSRLFVRLGQFYFSKASFQRQLELAAANAVAAPVRAAAEHATDALASLVRARLYFDKAIEIDDTDPIALRARGVVSQHRAVWSKQDSRGAAYEVGLLVESRKYLARSLSANPLEPGALFANAWLLANSVPPDCDGAIENLTLLISKASELPIGQRRKYIHSAYLNRANYRARLIRGKDPQTLQVQFDEIITDIQDGVKRAQVAERIESYKKDVRAEIEPGGDLQEVYGNSQDVKLAVDLL